MRRCNGCTELRCEPPCRSGAPWLVMCASPDKPAWLGKTRVIAASRAGRPVDVETPVWCPKTKSAVGRATNTPDGKI